MTLFTKKTNIPLSSPQTPHLSPKDDFLSFVRTKPSLRFDDKSKLRDACIYVCVFSPSGFLGKRKNTHTKTLSSSRRREERVVGEAFPYSVGVVVFLGDGVEGGFSESFFPRNNWSDGGKMIENIKSLGMENRVFFRNFLKSISLKANHDFFDIAFLRRYAEAARIVAEKALEGKLQLDGSLPTDATISLFIEEEFLLLSFRGTK